MRRASQIKSGEEVKGHRMKVKVSKNKLAPPFRVAEFDLIYGNGISEMGILLDLALNSEIAQKSGTWFSYGKERLGQGRENPIQFLDENPEIAAEISKKIKELNNLDKEETHEDQESIELE